MNRSLALILALPLLASATRAQDRPAKWWNDIAVLADDNMEGRQTGSDGYLRAADHVIARFKQIGLAPAGDDGGYFQQVGFEEQVVDSAASTVSLIGKDRSVIPVRPGIDMLISAGSGPRPAAVDAPMIFIGYGLHLPEQGHDDFAGVDLKGKIAVVIAGGPAEIPGPVKASNRSDRVKVLAERGAVGLITLTPPKQVEIPWERQKLLSPAPGMYLATPDLRMTPDSFLSATFDPGQSELLFTGSGHSFAELSALADASKPVPAFDLPYRLKATVAAKRRPLTSPNLVARLVGSDPTLKAEHVVLSAHLDHVGVGAPINGDAIYNGAMDDASGVASILDIAERLKAGKKLKRSILVVVVTAEEKGLLGSHYFAQRPTVPAGSIVADLNFDMPLPLWKLKTVLVQGENESTLGAVARGVAKRQKLALTPDPLPDRNSFVRTDQYSFVRAGIPALAFKFGFPKGTPEFDIEHQWRATRYHSPSDDLDQPGILKEEAIKLDDFVAGIATSVANAPKRPTWLPTSVFRKFATR